MGGYRSVQRWYVGSRVRYKVLRSSGVGTRRTVEETKMGWRVLVFYWYSPQA